MSLALPDLPRLQVVRRVQGVDTAGESARPPWLGCTGAFIGHYLRSRPTQFLALMALVLGASACAVGVQYGMKLMIDAMTTGARRPQAVQVALAVFTCLVALEAVMWRMSGWLGARTTIAAGVNIRLDLFRHLAGHSMRYFQDQMGGALGHRVTATAGAFGAIVTRMVWDVAPPCVSFLGALLLFATLDGGMTAALAGFVAATTTGLVAFGLRGRRHHRAYARRSSDVGGELMDVINNMLAVKTFSARDRERARLSDAFAAEAEAHGRSWLYNEKIRVANDVALVIMAAATLVWAAHLWRIGKITPGDVVLVSTLTFRLLHGSRDLAMSLIDMGQQYSFIGETLRLIGQPHALRDPAEPRRGPPRTGAITLNRVSFGYRPQTPILHSLDLHIPPGQRVGLVGASGAGKSTLTQLVQRLYEVNSGQVLVDGQAVQDYAQDDLRARIAVVPQEVSLFHRSVMENIRFGRPEASDAEVFAAARAAHCDFIADLHEGYDTVVGERGAKLSGGQRQRIGIARAFLKDAPILILDEATSALDAESEAAVQLALSDLMEGRTVLAIAHRLSTLTDMDRILVLSDGEVVEDGAPFELQRRGGAFARLWRMQTDGCVVPLPRQPLKAVG
ncbi:ABC transporter ATP-binding protein [Caulobacter sp. S45]|uniref:ABC transporter ATP-binding protein n=1 Tax=Caulobacter sp. S45 TaxID=1641861 RepID=UPI001C2DBECD|nr:ABC transporter ATP-binding protein [Caulobacter sp. S45]